jgi:hypothetical protein
MTFRRDYSVESRNINNLHAINRRVFSFYQVSIMNTGIKAKRGQAMVEFVVVMGMLLSAVAIMMVFLGTFREYGTRVLNLVGSEYP